MLNKTFVAEDKTIGVIFGDDTQGGFIFSLPLYQRPYAWTDRQTNDLVDDLINAMDDERGTQPYFLGSIVLIEKGTTSIIHEVIDGQQRLTTLTILLCVLRELDHDDDLNPFILRKGNRHQGTKDLFRITLRERDKDFFRKNVQKLGGIENILNEKAEADSDSQQRILDNTKLLWERLSKLSQGCRERLSKFVIQNCSIVVISTDGKESAHRIFSVLNARGLDLNSTDILKSEIIGEVSGKNQEDYTQIWEDIEDDLGRDHFVNLFANIYMIYARQKPGRSLDSGFQKDVLQGALKPINGEKFMDTVLTPYTEAYKVVSDAAYESANDAEKVNKCLQNLNRVRSANSFWIAAAMQFYKDCGDDTDMFYRLIKDLERLTYGLFFLPITRDSRRLRYHKVLEIFEQTRDRIFEDTDGLQLSDNEKKVILGQLDEPLNKRLQKPLLLVLDSAMTDAGANYEHKVITLEHVLPQNPKPDSEWLDWFPDADEREHWTNKLANLVLLSRGKNSQASNFEFEDKKERYFKRNGVRTPFTLTSQVIDEAEWTPKVLELRQQKLIAVLMKEWRLG